MLVKHVYKQYVSNNLLLLIFVYNLNLFKLYSLGSHLLWNKIYEIRNFVLGF